MIKAEDAKRITQNSRHKPDIVTLTEYQILRAAMQGKTDMIRIQPYKPEDTQRLILALTDRGYKTDNQETMNGKFRPGSLLKISWD